MIKKIRAFFGVVQNRYYIVIALLAMSLIAIPIIITVYSSNVSLSSDSTLVYYSSQSNQFDDNFSPYVNSEQTPNNLLFEPLFYYSQSSSVSASETELATDSSGNRVYVCLADSRHWNKAGTEFTVHLNERAQWSNGSPVTADDIIYTFKEVRKNKLYTPFDIVKKISVIDSYTVKFVFNNECKENEEYIFSGFYILPACQEGKYNIKTIRQSDCVTTGPFLCTEYKPDGITFSINQNYWNQKPKVQKIFFVPFIGDSYLIKGFAENTVELAIIDTSKQPVSKQIEAEIKSNSSYNMQKFDNNFTIIYNHKADKGWVFNFDSNSERTFDESISALDKYLFMQICALY